MQGSVSSRHTESERERARASERKAATTYNSGYVAEQIPVEDCPEEHCEDAEDALVVVNRVYIPVPVDVVLVEGKQRGKKVYAPVPHCCYCHHGPV